MCLYIQLLESGRRHTHWNVLCSECAETRTDNLAPGWAEVVLKRLLVELGFRKLYPFIPGGCPSTGERVVWTVLPGDGTGSSWQVLWLFELDLTNRGSDRKSQCFRNKLVLNALSEQMFVTVTLHSRSTEDKYECSQSKLNNLFERIFTGK